MDSNKRTIDTADGRSNSKGAPKSPNQPPGRTSEASEPVESDQCTIAEGTLSSTGTTNLNRFERRKTNNLKPDVPSQVHPSLKTGTAAFLNDNPSSGGMLANEVPILPTPIIPLRDILEGGMNLGDSHLTYHSTLPKRKQKRPRIPAEQDNLYIPPQNSSNPVPTGLTLGDNNQYSVPKTTTRILRENPEMDDLPVVDISGGSSIPHVSEILQKSSPKHTINVDNPERELPESPNNNFLSNNSQGNFVEGLSGRVSFLSKQNSSTKGALEGGSSAVNVSKRPKQAGVPKPLANDVSTNVSNPVVQKTVLKEIKINHSELLSANDPKQSHQKYHKKESKRLDKPDVSYLDQSEPKLPLIDMLQTMKESPKLEIMPEDPTRGLPGNNTLSTTRAHLPAPRKLDQFELNSSLEISPPESSKEITTEVPNVLVIEKPERNDTYQLGQKSKSDVTPNNLHATVMRNDALKSDFTPSQIDQQEVLNQKRNTDDEGLAVPRRSARKGPNQHRDTNNMTVNRNDEWDPRASKAANQQTDQKESAPKKKRKPKEELAKTELKALSEELRGGNTAKTTPLPSIPDDERNRAFIERKVPRAQKIEPQPMEIKGKDKQEATSSQKVDSLVTTSSSIIDLPVPDYMNE